MSTNKVEMSLDEIIKANKRKENAAGRSNAGKKKGAGGIAKRRLSVAAKRNAAAGGVQKRGRAVANTPVRKNNAKGNRFKKNVARGNPKTVGKNFQTKNRTSPKAGNTIATKRLVQNLVKKALAQRNVRVSASRASVTPTAIRRRGGVRMVKKTVVLNRISPKSRVIAQRRRVVAAPITTVMKRAPIRYNTIPQTVQIVSPAPIRRNYVPVQQRRFVERVERRPVVVQRAARPGYQLVEVPIGGGGGSVRQQINAMRRNAAYVPQQQRKQRMQVQQVHQPRRFRQQQRQTKQQQQRVTFVEQRIQPQQRRRFQGGRRNHQQQDAFIEPPNFLQRIPAQQPVIVRRF